MNGESVGESVMEQKKEVKNSSFYFSYQKNQSDKSSGGESLQGESASSSDYSDKSEPRRDYVNETDVKRIYTELKCRIDKKEETLNRLAKEYAKMPPQLMETRKIIKEQITNLKEEVDELKRKLIILTLENPHMFKVELNDVNVYER